MHRVLVGYLCRSVSSSCSDRAHISVSVQSIGWDSSGCPCPGYLSAPEAVWWSSQPGGNMKYIHPKNQFEVGKKFPLSVERRIYRMGCGKANLIPPRSSFSPMYYNDLRMLRKGFPKVSALFLYRPATCDRTTLLDNQLRLLIENLSLCRGCTEKDSAQSHSYTDPGHKLSLRDQREAGRCLRRIRRPR